MKKQFYSALAAATLLSALAVPAAAQAPYKLPPKEIVDLIDEALKRPSRGMLRPEWARGL